MVYTLLIMETTHTPSDTQTKCSHEVRKQRNINVLYRSVLISKNVIIMSFCFTSLKSLWVIIWQIVFKNYCVRETIEHWEALLKRIQNIISSSLYSFSFRLGKLPRELKIHLSEICTHKWFITYNGVTCGVWSVYSYLRGFPGSIKK